MGRSGVTLIEVMLMTSLALGLMMVCYELLKRSNTITDSAAGSINLQVGVRNLLENMVRDVGSCQQMLKPDGDADKNLVLVKPASDDVQKRLDTNTDKAFPFVSTADTTTKQKMDCVRVTYNWDPSKRTVRRKEEAGEFVAESDPSNPVTLSKFTFNVASMVRDSELATSVETLTLTYLGYDTNGDFKLAGQNNFGYEKTAVLAVRINSQFDEGVYQSGSGHTQPKIEIVTKIWSMKRRSDEVYKEYFSSTDEDLRW